MTALVRASSYCKLQAPHQQTRNCLTVINIWSQAPDGCFIPRHTDRLTVGHNIRLDSETFRPFRVGAFLSPSTLSEGENIVCFEHLPHTSVQIDERTLSVASKSQTRRLLLSNSRIRVTVIARQRPLYYCVCVSKSKCLLA
jgi:hypothetical protein